MHYRLKFLKVGVFFLVGVALLSWLVMNLWNWLIPGLFTGVNTLDYTHALGLLVLCRILFGGFRGRGGQHGWHHGHRWQQMSEVDREKFMHGMRMFRDREVL